MAPSKMKALLTVGDGTMRLIDTDVPSLQPGFILVKVVTVAQNPTDCTSLRHIPLIMFRGLCFHREDR